MEMKHEIEMYSFLRDNVSGQALTSALIDNTQW